MVALSALKSRFFEPLPQVPGHEYLLGLRGLLVLESFAWLFLQTFAPTAVKGSNNTDGPGYQTLLRKTASVLLWNDSLIYSSFILLSARTICISFFKDPSTTAVASAAFRRGLSLGIPVAVALAIIKITFWQIGLQYIYDFITLTGNKSINTPYYIPNALAYFNSVFDLFWTTTAFLAQAGNTAFPSQTLWIVNVIYSQSYTVYMTMIIIPYTRPSWRVQAFTIFIITAWWVQSWAWYSVTGLLLADAIINMDFKKKSQCGIKIYRSIRLPSWILYGILMAAGLTMQYLWVAWRPDLTNYELEGHTGLYYTGGLNVNYNVGQPQARDDNYLVVLGGFLLLETSDFLQRLFANPLFIYLGKRSYSYFLIQSIITYTLGIKLFVYLTVTKSTTFATAFLSCLGACFAGTALSAEVLHWLVEYPARVWARMTFDWIRK